MTTRFAGVGLLALCAACSGIPGNNDGGFKDGGGGGGGGGGLAKFGTTDLDSDAGPELTYLAIAVDPVQERVGVAYFARVDAFGGTIGPDGGLTDNLAADGGNTPNYDVRYVEWKQGVVSSPQTIRTVQRLIGISVAFQPNGEPAVAYLGGGSDMSAYWYQSDAVVAYRAGGTIWTEQVAQVRSDDPGAVCAATPPAPTEIGFLVGVWPSLVFDGSNAILAYRDVHNGAFPQQDWAASDVKISEGGPASWTHACVAFCGNNKQGWGGRNDLILANGQPAIVFDKALGGADTPGEDVLFMRRKADLTWTPAAVALSIGNTQSGGSLAWDSVEGYGIAAIEHSTDKLLYTRSVDGAVWDTATAVFGSGSGGWYPSLAMDPVHHEPAIAFYICSARGGVAEGTCLASEDKLMVTQRISGNWTQEQVDAEGGYLPKLAFFASGKRVMAYRVPSTKAIRLAVER